MNTQEWFQLIELASVAAVIVATIFIMQHLLTKAHILLRLGLALVCAGSIIELYGSLQTVEVQCDLLANSSGVVENLGQAAVYVWAATSKRLWGVLDSMYRRKEAV